MGDTEVCGCAESVALKAEVKRQGDIIGAISIQASNADAEVKRLRDALGKSEQEYLSALAENNDLRAALEGSEHGE